ncbi:hypothetical protein VQ056_26205 [Paenibacillus sp. JTLBN-2024]
MWRRSGDELIPGTPNVIPGKSSSPWTSAIPTGPSWKRLRAYFVGLLHEVARRRNVDIETETLDEYRADCHGCGAYGCHRADLPIAGFAVPADAERRRP